MLVLTPGLALRNMLNTEQWESLAQGKPNKTRVFKTKSKRVLHLPACSSGRLASISRPADTAVRSIVQLVAGCSQGCWIQLAAIANPIWLDDFTVQLRRPLMFSRSDKRLWDSVKALQSMARAHLAASLRLC